ncbi:MAG: dehydrogenase, partial [Bacteroidales bacterium]|nr:dehydrogenase [Bacteroidales bacterium]
KEGKNKFGFFASEKETFAELAAEQEIIRLSDSPARYCRHPLVFLVEAADDITYQIMDVEDAHKLKILTYQETLNILTAFWDAGSEEGKKYFSNMNEIFQTVTDVNERISYMRATLINKLVGECISAFMQHYQEIMNGRFSQSLVDSLSAASAAGMKQCRDISIDRIYNHTSVVEVELAGYRILGALLDDFIDSALHPQSHYAKKLLMLLPEQYRSRQDAPIYTQIQSVLDFVSGMTDLFALDLYRTIHGMKISYQ